MLVLICGSLLTLGFWKWASHRPYGRVKQSPVYDMVFLGLAIGRLHTYFPMVRQQLWIIVIPLMEITLSWLERKGYILNGDWLMIDFKEGEQEKLIRQTAYIMTESTIAE